MAVDDGVALQTRAEVEAHVASHKRWLSRGLYANGASPRWTPPYPPVLYGAHVLATQRDFAIPFDLHWQWMHKRLKRVERPTAYAKISKSTVGRSRRLAFGFVFNAADQDRAGLMKVRSPAAEPCACMRRCGTDCLNRWRTIRGCCAGPADHSE